MAVETKTKTKTSTTIRITVVVIAFAAVGFAIAYATFPAFKQDREMRLTQIEINRLNWQLERESAAWKAGMTNLSQMDTDEIIKHTGYKQPESSIAPPIEYEEFIQIAEPVLPEVVDDGGGNIPSNFSWTNVDGENYMTHVKFQGECRSCWAFTAIGIVEALYNIEGPDSGLNLNLSEQELISCTTLSEVEGGCEGGSPQEAFEYIKNDGIGSEEDCPYVASETACLNPNCKRDIDNRYPIGFWVPLPITSEKEEVRMTKEVVYKHGPVSIAMNVFDNFKDYSSGVYSYSGDDDPISRHTVIIVGYDDTNNAFKIKNSWSTEWGENGYGWISYNDYGHKKTLDRDRHLASIKGLNLSKMDLYSPGLSWEGNDLIMSDYKTKLTPPKSKEDRRFQEIFYPEVSTKYYFDSDYRISYTGPQAEYPYNQEVSFSTDEPVTVTQCNDLSNPLLTSMELRGFPSNTGAKEDLYLRSFGLPINIEEADMTPRSDLTNKKYTCHDGAEVTERKRKRLNSIKGEISFENFCLDDYQIRAKIKRNSGCCRLDENDDALGTFDSPEYSSVRLVGSTDREFDIDINKSFNYIENSGENLEIELYLVRGSREDLLSIETITFSPTNDHCMIGFEDARLADFEQITEFSSDQMIEVIGQKSRLDSPLDLMGRILVVGIDWFSLPDDRIYTNSLDLPSNSFYAFETENPITGSTEIDSHNIFKNSNKQHNQLGPNQQFVDYNGELVTVIKVPKVVDSDTGKLELFKNTNY